KYNIKINKIHCDENQMQQVFLNILMNAWQAIKDNGEITIETKYQKAKNNDGFVEISFTDTGSGIKDEIIDHIFEPFFSTKDIGKGTGLGLSICKQIVQDHNGYIKVKSELGKGSKFSVFLPISH
ncbi:GHKL domain-containing protein, partial [bacterium]|nr:GHKL domain-containing protein [bacterium]